MFFKMEFSSEEDMKSKLLKKAVFCLISFDHICNY